MVGAGRGSAGQRPGPAPLLPRPPRGRSRLGPARRGGERAKAAGSTGWAGSGLRGCARTGAVATEPARVRGRAGLGLGAGIGKRSVLTPPSLLPGIAAVRLCLASPSPRIPHPQLLPLPLPHPSRYHCPPKASAPLRDPPLSAPIPSDCPFP